MGQQWYSSQNALRGLWMCSVHRPKLSYNSEETALRWFLLTVERSYKKKFCFFFNWLLWAFFPVHRLSLAAESGGFSFSWLLSLRSRGSGCMLWCRGLAALRHVGSSRMRDQICVCCIGRRILNQWTTRGSHWVVYVLDIKKHGDE